MKLKGGQKKALQWKGNFFFKVNPTPNMGLELTAPT